MLKITPFLWFDHQAEEAADFYVSVFKQARILSISRNEEGSVFTVSFQLDGQEFIALNGGPAFTFTPAISFFVHCDTQAEVDYYWENLSKGGEVQQCGWLKDRYGISWQIVPEILGKLLADPDPVKAERVNQAMLGMVKLDIRQLQAAYDGK
jgi:predicted 3-demethylubiquinone-9 3-methyltransferase (glyoxalase superfamily)